MEILGIILFGILVVVWIWYVVVSHSGTLNGFAHSKRVFSAFFVVGFLPLFIFFLIPFIFKFLTEGDISAFVSTFLFMGFAISYISKLQIQASFLIYIQETLSQTGMENDPEVVKMIQKLRKSYFWVVLFSPVILSGLVPFLHLLTIWVVMPLAMILPFLYPESRFFYQISRYLLVTKGQSFSPQLSLLNFSLISTFIFAPLLYFALMSGLSALF